MSDSLPPMTPNIADFLIESGVENVLETEGFSASYQVDAATKIAVNKRHGQLIKSRIEAAQKARKSHTDAWDESIRYYNNSQQDHRTDGAVGMSANRYFAARRNPKHTETENIVYANVRATIPALYAKNPTAEFTCHAEKYKKQTQQLESLVNTLASIKHSPGLNLRMHAKQAVTCAELCNIAWLEVGYTTRDRSNAVAQEALDALSEELLAAKDEKEIREIEGKILALEDEIDLLTPAGPMVKYRPAHSVLTDPLALMPDGTDASWMAFDELWPTSYLNAKFGEKGEDGRVMSIFEPTAVISAGASSTDESSLISLQDNNAESKSFGYENVAELRKAYRTRCWRYFDKVTRRVYLYADNKWDWPIWVENDPYGLPGFFPAVPLYFNTTPLSMYARSNTTYYLDQQDAINDIHSEFHRARKTLVDNVLFDNRFSKVSVEAFLRGGDVPTATGVDVPDGMRLSDAILEKPNVILKAQPLFDTARIYASVDRVSGVSDVMRGVQFKTNTTNQAIESYNSSTATRLDEKIDAIEECIGQVLYNIAFLCAQFMPADQVAMLIGDERAEAWANYTPKELISMFQCQVVGGSTQKPTSDAKKQQALQMADILMKQIQFAPTTTITLVLTLLNDAFDELALPPNAFEKIAEEAKMAMERGNSVQGGGAGGAEEPGGQGSSVPPAVEELVNAVDALPPAAKLALGDAMAKGVSVMEALPEILRAVQQSSPNESQ